MRRKERRKKNEKEERDKKKGREGKGRTACERREIKKEKENCALEKINQISTREGNFPP